MCLCLVNSLFTVCLYPNSKKFKRYTWFKKQTFSPIISVFTCSGRCPTSGHPETGVRTHPHSHMGAPNSETVDIMCSIRWWYTGTLLRLVLASLYSLLNFCKWFGLDKWFSGFWLFCRNQLYKLVYTFVTHYYCLLLGNTAC